MYPDIQDAGSQLPDITGVFPPDKCIICFEGHMLPEAHRPPVPQRCGDSVGYQPKVNGLASPRGLGSGDG